MSFAYGPNYRALNEALQEGGTSASKGMGAARESRGLATSSLVERLGEKIDTPQSVEQRILAKYEEVKRSGETLKEKMQAAGIEEDPVTEELDLSEVDMSGDVTDFIASFESFSSNAYEDFGQLSIGFGTKATSKDQTMTLEDAKKELVKETMKARKEVLRVAEKYGYDWAPHQVDALTSFTYNLGPGGLDQLTEGGTRGDEEISYMMLEYNKANGKTLGGLTKRRQAESALFSQGYNQ